jgi:hypothetical protein
MGTVTIHPRFLDATQLTIDLDDEIPVLRDIFGQPIDPEVLELIGLDPVGWDRLCQAQPKPEKRPYCEIIHWPFPARSSQPA